MTPLEQARRLCQDYGGAGVDLFRLPREVIAMAPAHRGSLPRSARQVVGAWLVVRAQQGDAEARDRLVSLWHEDLVRWCRWNAGRGIDPDDAAHEILLRVFRRLHTLTRPEGFGPWMWSVAWRVLRELERKPWLIRWLYSLEQRFTDPGPDPEEQLAQTERLDLVQRVLHALDLDDRALLWDAYVEGSTRAQIAERVGLPVGTVNRRLTQARQRFRQEAIRLGLGDTIHLGVA